MADYIPQGDATFDTWQINYVTYFVANAAALGLDPIADVLQINNAQTAWGGSYAAHIVAQAAAVSARGLKDTDRDAFIGILRGFTGQIQANPATTDVQRAALDITIPDTTPTPVGPPTTRPVLEADTSQRLQITVAFRDEFALDKAKPDGVIGCEI